MLRGDSRHFVLESRESIPQLSELTLLPANRRGQLRYPMIRQRRLQLLRLKLRSKSLDVGSRRLQLSRCAAQLRVQLRN